MARTVEDIANDIRRLSVDDKGELLLTLMAELDAPSVLELGVLVKKLATSITSVNRSLDCAIARLDGLDEAIERGRVEVQRSVREAEDQWPFPI